MDKLKRVLITAGGTGGHVFPGLAVAIAMRAQGIEVKWMGTDKGLESRLVPDANFQLKKITVSGLRGKNVKTLLTAPLQLSKALMQASNIIKEFNPDVVLGMGGFVSGPGGLASWLLRKPLIIHEQNARAGLTNQILSKLATKTLAGFPHAFKRNASVLTVGNPVRAELNDFAPPNIRLAARTGRMRLLVLGGSLGAQALNHLLPHVLAKFPEALCPEVRHQTGDKHYDATKKEYEALGVKAELMPFITDMPGAYAWADVVLCRAGALTVAELCSAGLGAILIPYPHAVDDHQTANADFMVKAKAAICIQQQALTEQKLTDLLMELSQKPEKTLAMAEAAYTLRQGDVVEKIIEICREVCR